MNEFEEIGAPDLSYPVSRRTAKQARNQRRRFRNSLSSSHESIQSGINNRKKTITLPKLKCLEQPE